MLTPEQAKDLQEGLGDCIPETLSNGRHSIYKTWDCFCPGPPEDEHCSSPDLLIGRIIRKLEELYVVVIYPSTDLELRGRGTGKVLWRAGLGIKHQLARAVAAGLWAAEREIEMRVRLNKALAALKQHSDELEAAAQPQDAPGGAEPCEPDPSPNPDAIRLLTDIAAQYDPSPLTDDLQWAIDQLQGRKDPKPVIEVCPVDHGAMVAKLAAVQRDLKAMMVALQVVEAANPSERK